MTNAELIAVLRELPPDIEVAIEVASGEDHRVEIAECAGGGASGDIYVVIRGAERLWFRRRESRRRAYRRRFRRRIRADSVAPPRSREACLGSVAGTPSFPA